MQFKNELTSVFSLKGYNSTYIVSVFNFRLNWKKNAMKTNQMGGCIQNRYCQDLQRTHYSDHYYRGAQFLKFKPKCCTILWAYRGCSFCRLIRRPEHLIGRYWYLQTNRSSFIRWSSAQWVGQCYAIECDRSFYCALFCVFYDSCESMSNQPGRWAPDICSKFAKTIYFVALFRGCWVRNSAETTATVAKIFRDISQSLQAMEVQ
jgi:hypothetical protein